MTWYVWLGIGSHLGLLNSESFTITIPFLSPDVENQVLSPKGLIGPGIYIGNGNNKARLSLQYKCTLL